MNSEIYPDRETAYRRFASQLHKNFPILNTPRDQHRKLHRVVETEKLDFYCIFKKDFFMTFNKKFEDFIKLHPEYDGAGETINFEALLKILKRKKPVILVFIYLNKKKYVIYPRQFYKFATTHELFRVQDAVNSIKKNDYSGKKDYVNEITAHIPVKILRNFDDWIEKNG